MVAVTQQSTGDSGERPGLWVSGIALRVLSTAVFHIWARTSAGPTQLTHLCLEGSIQMKEWESGGHQDGC